MVFLFVCLFHPGFCCIALLNGSPVNNSGVYSVFVSPSSISLSNTVLGGTGWQTAKAKQKK